MGDNSGALTLGGDCDRDQILASVTGDRQTVIQRGFSWYDAQVPYSQSDSHEGYRTDCSGFVSMCWQLSQSYTTADFYDGSGDNSLLGSYDELLPGDALVHRSGGEGHVVLFVGWQDASQSAACVIEQESTALGMQFHARTSDSLQSGGYKPIRSNSLGTDGVVGSPGSDPNLGSGFPDPNAPDPNGQQSQTSCIDVGSQCNDNSQCCSYYCDPTGTCVDPNQIVGP